MTGARECLGCGQLRVGNPPAAQCPRCGYLGWAPTRELTETTRRELRDHPIELRALHALGLRTAHT